MLLIHLPGAGFQLKPGRFLLKVEGMENSSSSSSSLVTKNWWISGMFLIATVAGFCSNSNWLPQLPKSLFHIIRFPHWIDQHALDSTQGQLWHRCMRRLSLAVVERAKFHLPTLDRPNKTYQHNPLHSRSIEFPPPRPIAIPPVAQSLEL